MTDKKNDYDLWIDTLSIEENQKLEVVKKIMFMIGNEYENFIPNNQEMFQKKVMTWYTMLKKFDNNSLQQATMQMLSTHVYGTPKIAHLISVLQPKAEDENIGAEFADRLISLNRVYGAAKETTYFKNGCYVKEIANSISVLGDRILSEFGQVGYDTYLNLKEDLRVLEEDNISTFKAQVRNVFNSKNERIQLDPNYQLSYKDKISQLEIPEQLQIGE